MEDRQTQAIDETFVFLVLFLIKPNDFCPERTREREKFSNR